jgi:RNA polymerase sigma-70 factor (ECF subfamily)
VPDLCLVMSTQEMLSDDSPLLLRLKEGDRTAFDEIFNRHAGRVLTYIRRRLNGAAEADDILQEVFLRLWNKRDSIVIHSSFRNYIYAIVQNCISDHLRAAKKKKYTLVDEFQEQATERPQPDEQYQHKQVYHIWKNATNKLPGQMRRIYVMKTEDQLTVKEIASQLQLSEQTVKNQLHTAGQRIVKILRQVQLFFL